MKLILGYSKDTGVLHIRFLSWHIYIGKRLMKKISMTQQVRKQNNGKFRKLRHQLWKARGRCCEFCGAPLDLDDAQLHHIRPLTEAPELATEPDNLMICCDACHKAAHQPLDTPMEIGNN